MAEHHATITITTHRTASEALRMRTLHQGNYPEQSMVVMRDSLLMLEGLDHRARRRLENPLFTLDAVRAWEDEVFPTIVEEVLAPHAAAGRTDLVEFGHQLLMNVAARATGLDRPRGTADETRDLYGHMMTFIEGAILATSTRDHQEVHDEIEAALDEFEEEFLAPSAERRRDLLARHARGDLADEELTEDLLTVLLREVDAGRMTWDVLRREVAVFLLASAHTSATAFTRTAHHLLHWFADHPEDRDRTGDRHFLQRALSETIRLFPSNPVTARWATEDVELRDGTRVPAGAHVVVDLMAVNRDPELFGEDAGEFNPWRTPAEGHALYGLSFGMGTHACIGQRLAGGLLSDDVEPDRRVHGIVAVALQALFRGDVQLDPHDPAVRDTTTERPYWRRYPVLLRDRRPE